MYNKSILYKYRSHVLISAGFYLEGEVVALYHCLPVVLMQRGWLRLLHFGFKLRGEHVLHSVNGSADLNA